MKKSFVCSLCHNGILGGALYLDESAVTYKTGKLTVDKEYRNIILPLGEIDDVTWRGVLFPTATFYMSGGKKYTFIIFNRRRFDKYYKEARACALAQKHSDGE